jgi:hypothetical protein
MIAAPARPHSRACCASPDVTTLRVFCRAAVTGRRNSTAVGRGSRVDSLDMNSQRRQVDLAVELRGTEFVFPTGRFLVV